MVAEGGEAVAAAAGNVAGNGEVGVEAAVNIAAAAAPAAADVDRAAEDDQVEALDVTEENAQKLFESGCAALKNGDFEAAGDELCKALEIRTKLFGELAPECATVYYKYGCSLLYKVQSEREILPGPTVSKEKGGEPTDAGAEDMEEDVEPAGGSAGQANEEEDIQDEEESDLELAWKMMDIARVIHEKQRCHTIEEVDVISGLADISLEKEDFQTCYDDYNQALEILKGLVESDDRQLAELYFKMALAKQLAKAPADAIEYCQKAIAVCESRLERLKAELSEESTRSAKEGEIKELDTLSADLKEKIEELQQMAAAPTLQALQRENPELVETVKLAFMAAAAADGKFPASSSASEEVHLGVVGRGIKRTAPIPISENGNGKRSMTDDHAASS